MFVVWFICLPGSSCFSREHLPLWSNGSFPTGGGDDAWAATWDQTFPAIGISNGFFHSSAETVHSGWAPNFFREMCEVPFCIFSLPAGSETFQLQTHGGGLACSLYPSKPSFPASDLAPVGGHPNPGDPYLCMCKFTLATFFFRKLMCSVCHCLSNSVVASRKRKNLYSAVSVLCTHKSIDQFLM